MTRVVDVRTGEIGFIRDELKPLIGSTTQVPFLNLIHVQQPDGSWKEHQIVEQRSANHLQPT